MIFCAAGLTITVDRKRRHLVRELYRCLSSTTNKKTAKNALKTTELSLYFIPKLNRSLTSTKVSVICLEYSAEHYVYMS